VSEIQQFQEYGISFGLEIENSGIKYRIWNSLFVFGELESGIQKLLALGLKLEYEWNIQFQNWNTKSELKSLLLLVHYFY